MGDRLNTSSGIKKFLLNMRGRTVMNKILCIFMECCMVLHNQLFCDLCTSSNHKQDKVNDKSFCRENLHRSYYSKHSERQKVPNFSRTLKQNINDVVGPLTSEVDNDHQKIGTRKI